MDQSRQDAYGALLHLYGERPDLQQAYPEAANGDYLSLTTWAVRVCTKAWFDPAWTLLHPHERWYLQEQSAEGRNPAVAFKAWDQAKESLEDVEMRIHDGVPRQKLHARAAGYVDSLCRHFPQAMPRPECVVMEIGSGVGYILEAAHRKFRPRRLIGLDVAPAMIAKAQQRLARDKVEISPSFVLYDGVTIPLKSKSLDFIYSVACLQHIPKPHVYNLFGEILRLLKVDGSAALHLLSFETLKLWTSYNFRDEIAQQLIGAKAHWHHFYSAEELSCVLEYGYGAARLKIVETPDGSIWASFGPKG
jgi:2-polyprenyl-3-methyl-5-hydroxy-6-metoxy-1,4-benzoquinol methylase